VIVNPEILHFQCIETESICMNFEYITKTAQDQDLLYTYNLARHLHLSVALNVENLYAFNKKKQGLNMFIQNLPNLLSCPVFTIQFIHNRIN